MANSVYDEEKPQELDKNPGRFEQEFADRATSPGFKKASDDMDEAQRGQAAKASSKSKSPQELAGAEAAGAVGGASAAESREGSQLSSGNVGQKSGFGYRKEAASKMGKIKAKFKGKKKGKWLLVGGGVGGFTLILILLLLIGSLLIPHFIANVTEYEFARVVRNMTRNEVELDAEKMSADAADNTIRSRIASTFNDAADNTYHRLNNYRPSKIVKRMDTRGQVHYAYKGDTLTKVTVNGIDYKINPDRFFSGDRLHPIQLFKSRVDAYSALKDVAYKSIGDSTGTLAAVVRSGVGRVIREKLGIGLVGWAYEKYKNKTPAQDEALQEEEAFNKANDTRAADSSIDSQVNADAEAAAQAEQNAIDNPVELAKIVQNNGDSGLVGGALSAINSIGQSSVIQKVGQNLNLALAIALPLCIIYSGSVQKSGPTVDSQNTELQRVFYGTASQADQQKYGNTNAEAVGAGNWQINGATVNDSNAILRANGQPIDTSSDVSPQASAGGQLSYSSDIFSAILGNNVISHLLGDSASTICPAITSTTGTVVLALGGLAALLASPEGAPLADGAKTAVGKFLVKYADKLSIKLSANAADKIAPSTVFKKIFTIKELSKIAALGGLTFLARFIVASNSGQTHNGTAVGIQHDNEVDQGANLNANDTERLEFYGRPLMLAEVKTNDQSDKKYIADQIHQQSAYQRYFAISNNQSLISHLAISTYGAVDGKTIFSSLSSLTSRLFNPVSLLPKMFGSLNRNSVVAASLSDNQHYGIIQWGYSVEEDSLIKNDPSYQPLENAEAFTQEAHDYAVKTNYRCDLETDIQTGQPGCPSGHLQECFSPNVTVGTLLAQGSIQRDSYGNVLMGPYYNLLPGIPDCSPWSLGTSDNFGGEMQSVFRWRLMKSYNCTLDNLEEVQNPGQTINDTANDCPSENTSAGQQT